MAVNELPTETTKCVSNCVLLSSAFYRTPFLRPFHKLKPNLPTPVSPNIIRDLHHSFASKADECFRFLHLLASQNPILKTVFDFSSEFNRFNQICRRNNRNVNNLSHHNFAAVLPGDSVAGLVVANGISNFLNLYNTLLVVRLVLTWFPNSPPAIVSPLSTLCDPYLNIFRGLIPPLGGTLDLSPILAFLVLNAFTSTAAALPAELPAPGSSPQNHSSHNIFADLTTSQQKWMRRLCGNRSENSRGLN